MEEPEDWIETTEGLHAMMQEIGCADRIAVDLESNGLYVYRGNICTAQLAWHGRDSRTQVAVVDTLALGLGSLPLALEAEIPTKVLHDVCFDARLLGQEGIRLRSVRDTAVQATYLGLPATGLRALLEDKLGVRVDKELQVSDWGRRPIDARGLEYLKCDVRHLLTLEELLWQEVLEQGISDEVTTETEYRLANAYEAARKDIRPLMRVRGLEHVDEAGLAVVGELADERERLACDANVPAQRLLSDRILVSLGRIRPSCLSELLEIVSPLQWDDGVAPRLLEAISRGVAAGSLPEHDRDLVCRRPLECQEVARRRRLERNLRAWREAERSRRGVDPQVILPGHCLKHLSSGRWKTVEQISKMDGLGQARAARYAEQLSRLVSAEVGG